MKIEGQNAKLLNILKQLQQSNQQLSGKNQTGGKNTLENSSLPPSLENISSELQQLILQGWLNSDLPLKDEYLEQLVALLENGSTEFSNSTLIKSYIMLLKNNLPFSSLLLRSFARNFNPENTLTQMLFRHAEHIEKNGKIQPAIADTSNSTETRDTASLNDNSNQKPGVNPEQNINNFKTAGKKSGINQGNRKETLSTLLNKLGINPELGTDKLTQVLNDYPQQMIEIINILSNLEKGDSGKILEKILGQFLINTETVHQDTSLLLWLELPILFTETEPRPLYLEVRKNEEDNQSQQKENKNFKISFMIDLPRRGPVKADVFLLGNIIHGHFWAHEAKTVSLIKNTLPLLKENLEDIGYEIKEVKVEKVKNLKEGKKFKAEDFIPLPEEFRFSDQKYQHVDIRI